MMLILHNENKRDLQNLNAFKRTHTVYRDMVSIHGIFSHSVIKIESNCYK